MTGESQTPPSPAPPWSIRQVPIAALVPNHFFVRRYRNPAAFQELLQSIGQTHGPLQRPVVRDLGKGTWEIAFGHRRVEAVKARGASEIEVEVRALTDREMALCCLTENVIRENLTAIEEAELYWKVARLLWAERPERGGATPQLLTARQAARLLARHVGKSEDTVRKVLAVLPRDPHDRTRLRKIGASVELIRNAQAIARRLGSITEHDWVALAVEAMRQGWSVLDMKAEGQALLRTQVQPLSSPPPPPPYLPPARKHRCPLCGGEWTGECQPDPEGGEHYLPDCGGSSPC